MAKNLQKNSKNVEKKLNQNDTQSLDSFLSTKLADRCPSQKSSDGSFHSAESTIVKNLITKNNKDENSIIVNEDSLKNVTTTSEEVKSISMISCSSNEHDTLNRNINTNCGTTMSTNSNTSIQSDVDINKAQNLFKSTDSHSRDTNHNIDDASNTFNSTSNDDNLYYLLGNHSTTQYADIPNFIKSYASCSNSEASKEVARRLSTSFKRDPHEFAKRLMTIIEESSTNHDLENTGVGINDMVAAYMKLCKYVEEESMPSMCDNISPARHHEYEIQQNSSINKNVENNLLSQETSTPINLRTAPIRFGPTISPFSNKKNSSKIQSSPLYVATLSRATGSQKTPLSPKSSPGSKQTHNDSTFTFWEKQCKIKPVENVEYTVSDISEKDKEPIIKAEEQLRMLQENSPCKSPIQTDINIYNIHCNMQHSPTKFSMIVNFPKSECTSDTSSDTSECSSDINYEYDITESIMYELAEKRKRCIETERTIRQIDAESSVYSNSPQISGNELNEIIGFLNTLRTCENYEKILKPNEMKWAYEYRDDSKINNQSLSSTPHKSKNKSKKQLITKQSENLSSSQNNQHFNITMRKQKNKTSSRKKSPNFKISGSNLSEKDIKTNKSNTKSPALSSRQVSSSKLTVRPISPIDIPSTTESFKSISPLYFGTPSSFRSSNPSVESTHTPRAKSPNLQIYSSSNARGRFIKTPKPSSIKKSSSSKKQMATNTPGPVIRQKSNTQLLKADKGFTLEYLKSLSHTRSPRVNNAKLTTSKTHQRGNKCFGTIPTVSVTNATPLINKKSEKSVKLKGKDIDTPLRHGEVRNATGKFFNTPGKTFIPKIRSKSSSFFSLYNNEKSPITKLQTLTICTNSNNVKSPVAEYIHGTDTTLVQNIQGKKNEYLLTPRQNKSEKLKFKCAAKSNECENTKRTLIFDSEKVDLINDVNDENTCHNTYNHSKLFYQMSSVVQEIKPDLNAPHGARAKRLMEATDNRAVIQHAGRAIPRVRNVEQVDMSIHVAKSAEKKKFVLRHDTKRQ